VHYLPVHFQQEHDLFHLIMDYSPEHDGNGNHHHAISNHALSPTLLLQAAPTQSFESQLHQQQQLYRLLAPPVHHFSF
jgi:hypothetical protein